MKCLAILSLCLSSVLCEAEPQFPLPPLPHPRYLHGPVFPFPVKPVLDTTKSEDGEDGEDGEKVEAVVPAIPLGPFLPPYPGVAAHPWGPAYPRGLFPPYYPRLHPLLPTAPPSEEDQTEEEDM